MLRPDYFPGASALIQVDRDQLPPLTAGAHTHVVIMTHDLLLDGRALVWAAERPELPYIGLLGPLQRRERLLAMLQADGLDVMPRLAGRLRSPVGLDLGGDNEADIALAIVTQIQRDWHAATAADKTLAPR
jgi:xanthine/CO dehydrogenase XdhC/CoxF family maturation factor